MHTWRVLCYRGLPMECVKPFLTFEQRAEFEQQADLLEQRGLTFDRSTPITHLQDVDYFRLSGY